ncbi:MAG: ExbD/TolR family protein [Shimia sp.]
MSIGVQSSGRRSGRGAGRRSRTRPMAEINVTPFVDVMMVLLIIFMVAAPLLTVGVEVDLPDSEAGALTTPREEPLTVTLTAEGRLLIQTTEARMDDLVPQLRAIAAERGDRTVFLRADGTVPYAMVARVMGLLDAGGFSDIGLVHDAETPEG